MKYNLGFLKSVAIAPAELENAFAEGIGFDGSAIEGFARVTESDMLAKPDPATFSILPWRTEAPGAARMFCDIVMPDGTPSPADPRNVLRRTLEKAATMVTATPITKAFFIFPETAKAEQIPNTCTVIGLLSLNGSVSNCFVFTSLMIIALFAYIINVIILGFFNHGMNTVSSNCRTC